MKKFLALVLSALMMFSMTACGTQQIPASDQETPASSSQPASQPAEPATPSASSDTGSDDVPSIFKEKKIKIAIVRNLTADDGTKLFMATAQEIGKEWGWQVDTFITNNNDVQFQDTVTQIIQQDYDGIYISHGKAEYSYDLLKPAVEKGMKICTFDTIANDANGNPHPGVTAIAQDDEMMGEYSVNKIISLGNGNDPIKVLKLWFGPGAISALDVRNSVYEKYEKEGLIETVDVIGPTNMDDVMGDMYSRVSAALALYPEGTIDAVWGSWDELAKGALQAILEANRTEIKVVTVDCSDMDLNLMRENPDVFKACVGLHQKLYAVVGLRLLAFKLAELETPDTYKIPVNLVEVEALTPNSNVDNLNEIIPDWGVVTDYYAPWMENLGK